MLLPMPKFNSDHMIKNIKPNIVWYPDFFTKDECNSLISLAENKDVLKRGTVITRDGPVEDSIRTCKAGGVRHSKLKEKVIDEIPWPYKCIDDFTVLNYNVGEKFGVHPDWFFDPSEKITKQNKGQRVATFIIYLNTPESGGELVFPHLKLEFQPTTGSAVFFDYDVDDESQKKNSMHGSRPIKKGVKWAATLWFYEHPEQKMIPSLSS